MTFALIATACFAATACFILWRRVQCLEHNLHVVLHASGDAFHDQGNAIDGLLTQSRAMWQRLDNLEDSDSE